MNADLQLGRQSATSARTAMAWVMSIVFAGIAVISFAVDQTVITTAPFIETKTKTEAVGVNHSAAVFTPLGLIETLVGGASETIGQTR